MTVCSAPMCYRVSRTRLPFYGPRIDTFLLHTLDPRPSCFLSAHRLQRTPACVTERAGLYVVRSAWHCSVTFRDCCLKHLNPSLLREFTCVQIFLIPRGGRGLDIV